MHEQQGVIYILTNPSFPEYVKIGYADDIERRLSELNRSECVPFAFRVYATYAVPTRLTDLKIHDMIDRINPDLRAIDNVNGKRRIREFYAMNAEDAYRIFEAMAEIHGTTDLLKKITPNEEQEEEEKMANEVKETAREIRKPFSFDLVGIKAGEKIEFWPTARQRSGMECTVLGDLKHIEYDGKTYSLSSFAAKQLGSVKNLRGTCYFKYDGEWLNDMRDRLGV